MTRRDPTILLALAALIGFTAAHGGLWPGDRLLALGLWTLAGLAAVVDRPRFALRPALLLPVAALSLSLAFAPIPILGADEVLTWMAITCLAMASADDIESDKVVLAILVAALAGAASVFLEVAQTFILLGRPGIMAGAVGLMGGANVTGVVLALGLPAVFVLADRGKCSRGIAGAVSLVLFLAIVLTGSRTAILAGFAGVLLPARSLPKAWRRGLIAGGVLVVTLTAFLYLPKFLARLDPNYLTNAQRLSMVRGVLNAFLERPLLGYGPWSFPILGQAWLSWPKWELHPHSFPLRVLFETGLCGVAAWSLLGFSLKNHGSAASFRPAAAMALVLVVGSLTDDVLWLPIPALLLMSCLGALTPSRILLPRWLGLLMVLTTGALAATGPVLLVTDAAAVWPDPVGALDRAIATGSAPGYRGAERDPFALSVRGWQEWNRGETSSALRDLRRAGELDPHMVLGPHMLDLAYVTSAVEDETAAASWIARARTLAPVLTARFMGESGPVTASPLDWHYGIEFAHADALGLAAIPRWDDPLDWRHWRYRSVQALLVGDRLEAMKCLAVARRLVSGQYGRDPQLDRIDLAIGPPSRGTPESHENIRVVLEQRIRERDGAAYPWRVFGPLIHRQPLRTAGVNSPWWAERCGPRVKGP